ncbi:MAG: EAL domain-containing protein [Gammaproteobacteria bacterium]|nr:EAL domain-containing protein [Gammaproteobacteria bacterium]
MENSINTRPLQALFRNILLLGAAVYIAAMVYVWHLVLKDTEDSLKHINSMLIQGVRTTLKGHELILRGLGQELLAMGALENPENGRSIMERMKTFDPSMAGFGLARPDGQLVLVSGVKPGQDLPNLATLPQSRDSFKEVLESGQFRTGRAYFFKLFSRWVVPIRAPIFDEQGQLRAVCAAAYFIEQANVAWSNAELPPHTHTALMRDDGYLIFTQPLQEGSGQKVFEDTYGQPIAEETRLQITELKKTKSFVKINTPKQEHKTNYLAYNYIPEFDLHTGAYISQTAVTVRWLYRMIVPSIMFLTFILGGIWTYRRTSQRQEQVDADKRDSETRYRTLFDSAKDAIFLVRGNHFIECNPATLQMFGCTRDEIIGRTPQRFSPEFQPDGSSSNENANKKIKAAFNGKHQFFEWTHQKLDGTLFDAEISLNVVSIANEPHLLATVRNITDRKRIEQQLSFQAGHDSLTGLPNRKSLHEAFPGHKKVAKESGKHLVMLLLDLDRFKEVNDTLGHHLGDQLLAQVGPRLKQVYTDGQATIARLGGDEFAILVTTNESVNQITTLATSSIEVLRKPFTVSGITVSIGASIGVACYPQHGENSHELLRAADVAMYEAKKLSIGWKLYERNIDEYSRQRLRFANELAQAVEEKQLVLHYQPKIDIATGRTAGFEALVRWQHPTQGLLLPEAFIDLVEMGKVIHPFTQAVIELAVTEKKQLHSLGYTQPVAINLSALNLLDDACFNCLETALARHNLSTSEIELELTESAVMHDPKRAITILNMFKERGINIAIDDFGTGYSSLAYLRRLPVSSLKIDRTFVKDMRTNTQDSAIVRSTIALAHSLDLRVIAEGVEDKQTLELLHSMNCDQAQGYGICRPQPMKDLVEWLLVDQLQSFSHKQKKTAR